MKLVAYPKAARFAFVWDLCLLMCNYFSWYKISCIKKPKLNLSIFHEAAVCSEQIQIVSNSTRSQTIKDLILSRLLFNIPKSVRARILAQHQSSNFSSKGCIDTAEHEVWTIRLFHLADVSHHLSHSFPSFCSLRTRLPLSQTPFSSTVMERNHKTVSMPWAKWVGREVCINFGQQALRQHRPENSRGVEKAICYSVALLRAFEQGPVCFCVQARRAGVGPRQPVVLTHLAVISRDGLGAWHGCVVCRMLLLGGNKSMK